ncbi:MAG TPA: C4-type zinc ribbon domain-containing protein [Candidatus Nanopelagicaceae bacterium]
MEKLKANPSDQLQILDIQRMDFHLATLANRAASLPETLELLGKNQRLTVVRDLQIAAQTQISDIKRELLRSEADVEQVVVRLQRDEKRLADGATAAKELEKLQHEVKTLGGRLIELEEVELEIMLRMESVKDRLDELKVEESQLNEEIEGIERRKSEALAGIESEVALTMAERVATVAQVDGALVDLYEKVRAKNSGTGAAALREGRCDGCHLAINSVELSRMKTLASDEVVRCEECRCILVRGAK